MKGLALRKSITAIMLELLTLSRATGIWPQRDVVKYIRSAIALDGLIKSFAPGFDVGRHLELVCDRHLHWHAMRAAFSAGSILEWLEANSSLVRQGAAHSLRAMSRVASGRAPTAGRPPRPARTGESRSLRVAALAVAASLMAAAPQPGWTWGANMRSAAIIIAALSGVVAAWKIFKRPGRPSIDDA